MSTLDLIIKWAQEDLLDWQSDAVRRMLTQEELTKEDKNEILLMLKASHGLIDRKNTKESRPLKEGDLSGAPSCRIEIILKAIEDISNVNAIKDDSSLPIGHQGMTVIFGENGVGKSGYARVLKRACRARDSQERILPNVFSKECSGPAKASFKIDAGDKKDIKVSWVDKEDSPDILSNISVFDSKCARIIIDENNQAAYLPYGAHVFDSLVALLKEFREQLKQEKPEAKQLEYPDIPFQTKSGKFLSEITSKTSLAETESSFIWTDKEREQLEETEKRIYKAEKEDPKKQINRLNNLKNRINLFLDGLYLIDREMKDTRILALNRLVKAFKETQKALALSSGDSLKNEPLDGAGSDCWQILYRAAKKYSIEKAYIGQKFPYLDKGSKCVLCMQELLPESKNRMKRFAEFMEQTIQKRLQCLSRAIEKVENKLKSILLFSLNSYSDVLDELDSKQDGIRKKIEDYCKISQEKIAVILESIQKRNEITIERVIFNTEGDIKKILTNIEKEITELGKATNPKLLMEQLIEWKSYKSELEAKKNMVKRKGDIINYINKLKESEKYNSCIEDTEFRRITVKGRNIVSEALTPDFIESLGKELMELGADHLPLKLKPSGAEGEMRYKLELKCALPLDKISLTDILSEGEQNVVALAGFLAELGIAHHKCPIIFDDPVCSLDHIYKEKISGRLAKEAAIRQVIIFTHDISFLLVLKSKVASLGDTAFTTETVKKKLNVPGEIDNGLPWHALPTKERLGILDKELSSIESLYRSNMDNYNKEAALLYGRLRETWEAFIENDLLNSAVVRYEGNVRTQNLKEVEITTSIYRQIHIAMSKCSTWMIGHDKAKSLDVNRSKPEEIKNDIDILRKFSKEIRKRGDELREERESALEPKESEKG